MRFMEGTLGVDPIRDAERRGVYAVLSVLTEQVEDEDGVPQPGLLRFKFPEGAINDASIIGNEIDKALDELRKATQ